MVQCLLSTFYPPFRVTIAPIVPDYIRILHTIPICNTTTGRNRVDRFEPTLPGEYTPGYTFITPL